MSIGMGQDESRKKWFKSPLFLLIIIASVCLAAGILIILKNNIWDLKEKRSENDSSLTSVSYSEIPDSPDFIPQYYSGSQEEITLSDLTVPEYLSFKVNITESGVSTVHSVVICGDRYRIDGETKTVICDSVKTQVITPLYNIIFENDGFDLFSEIGIVSLDYIRNIMNEYPDDISTESDTEKYYITYVHDQAKESYEIQKSTGLVVAGMIEGNGLLVRRYVLSDMTSVDPEKYDENYFSIKY